MPLDTVTATEEELTRLLVRRTRIGLWLVAVSLAAFAAADLSLATRQAALLYGIKVAGGLALFGLFRALRRCRTRRRVEQIGLTTVALAATLSAASGVVIGDALSTPILCITIMLATSTLLPWGVLAQAATAGILGAAIVTNAYLLQHTLAIAAGYPGVALIVAFAAAILVGREMERHRREIGAEKIERERTARELLDSRERYSELIENANDAIFTHDLAGRFTAINRAAERLTGYSRAEALGMTVADLVMPDDLADVEKRMRRVRAHPEQFSVAAGIDPTPVERHLRTKDGRIVVAEVSSHLSFEDGRPVAVQGIAREVTERKTAERALRESEARMRDVAAHVPGIVYQFQVGADGSYSFPLVVDSPYLATFGITAKEVQENPVAPFNKILPEDRDALLAAIGEMAAAGQQRPVEFRVRSDTGEIKWFRASATVRKMADGAALSTGLIIDITDRKRAEEASMRMAAIVESSDDAIIGMTLNGTILNWNTGAERVYGYGADEVKGRSISLLLAPDRPDEVMQILERIKAGERIDHFETVRMRKDGRGIHVSLTVSPIKDGAGRVIGASTIARDISERIRMEDALRTARDELERRVEERTRELTSSNELLRREIAERQRAELELIAAREAALESSTQFGAVLQSVGEGIISSDESGRIVVVNREVEKIFGYRPDELTGQSIDVLIPERLRPAHRAGLEQYLRNRLPHLLGRRVEMQGLHKDGTTFPAELCVVETRIGQRTLFTAAVRDISERKRVESDLQRAKEIAEEASRAKSEFLANVSHEIRTPMNAVIGMTGLLLDTELTSEQREFAETVRSASSALLTLINDLLDFSKVESGRLELETQPFEVRACLEDSLDLLAPRAAEKDVELACFIDDSTPEMLVGDVGRLRQVLVNLLGNAVRFTHHGEVVVAVDARPTSDAADRDAAESHPAFRGRQLYEVHFRVRDTGIGIPSDRFERLFESFSQIDTSTTRRYGGTGLGLAISKRLTEIMGGRIWVESQVGEGSTFHFTICGAAAAGGERPSLRGRQPSLAGRRVLIVEPHPTHRRVLVEQVQAWGMIAREASSGIAALDMVRGGESFDVAVLDMQNPELSGTALAAEIRAYRDADALPLVMVTALGRWPGDRVEGAGRPGSEFIGFLTKPIKTSELYDVFMDLYGEPRLDTVRVQARPAISRLAERLPMRILVAEDNEVNQRVAVRILARMGYRADVAANGVEVIQALKRQPYDVVLMDVQMPEMDGLEASRRIRELWPGTAGPRIVAMTAHAMQGDREHCLSVGMDDYISKPVQIEQLQAALERCGGVAGPTRRGDGVPETIDRSALARLREGQEPDEPDLVTELINVFFEHAPVGVARIREAATTGNAAELNQAAHRLKSGSAQLGARTMSQLCADLERSGASGDLTGVQELVLHLEAEFERVREALTQERQPATGDAPAAD